MEKFSLASVITYFKFVTQFLRLLYFAIYLSNSFSLKCAEPDVVVSLVFELTQSPKVKTLALKLNK